MKDIFQFPPKPGSYGYLPGCEVCGVGSGRHHLSDCPVNAAELAWEKLSIGLKNPASRRPWVHGYVAARLSGPEGRAGETSGVERSGDHDSSPDATRVAGNESLDAKASAP